MRAIRQDSCLLHGGGPGPFYKPWGRDGFVTGWSFHYDGRPGSAPHRRLTNSCFEAAALYTFALPPHRRSSGGEGCVPFGEAVEGQTPNAVVLYLRKERLEGMPYGSPPSHDPPHPYGAAGARSLSLLRVTSIRLSLALGRSALVL